MFMPISGSKPSAAHLRWRRDERPSANSGTWTSGFAVWGPKIAHRVCSER